MEYSIKALAELAGITTRTLRYYDRIDLLKPERVSPSGYRYYGQAQVDLLQQILFYRQRGMELSQIQEILYREDFDVLQTLQEHLRALEQEKQRLDCMISTVQETIASMKGEKMMSDEKKFQCFKEKLVKENEEKYGDEVREKYGDEAADASAAKVMKMSKGEYENFQRCGDEILKMLAACVGEGKSPESDAGKAVAALHKQWLLMTWGEGTYSPEAHKGLVRMYVCDPRFTDYYDREQQGCAAFLRDAVVYWC